MVDTAPQTNKKNGMARSARRYSREIATQVLYAWLVGQNDLASLDAQIMDNQNYANADRAFLKALLHGAVEQADELRNIFSPFIDRELHILSPVEHAILLVGCYELKNRLDVPYRVVINEAVEIAKLYGGSDGFRYINGVLDKVAGVIRQSESTPPASTPSTTQ